MIQKEKIVKDASNSLYNKLKKMGIRAQIDQREITPGNKYYDWELKGIPLRVEIGPRDVEKKSIMLVRRDSGEKTSVPNIRRGLGLVL